jgi:hypothetical protein
MASVGKLASYEVAKHKAGEQIEWQVTLTGRTTIDQRMIDDAISLLHC